MSRGVLVLLLAAASLGCTSSAPPPETPDCTAGCGLDVACAADADCLFGLCSAGVCAARPGASPTGPVSATVSPAGGKLTLVSEAGVTLEVDFPEGSVAAPLDVTLTPQAPGPGWLSVSLAPAGVVLEKPARVTVTLPAGTTRAADASLRFVTPDDFQLVPSSGGTTLTGELRSLGMPGLAGGAATRTVLGLPSPASLLVALPLPLRAKVDLANLLLDALIATDRYRDAVELQLTLTDLLLHRGDPDFDAIAGRLLDRVATTSCEALASRISRLETATPQCAAEHEHWMRPVMNWAVVMQKVDAGRTAHCAAMDEYVAAIGRSAAQTITRIQSDAAAAIRCDCRWTAESRWGRKQRLVCPRFLPFSGPASLPEDDFGAFTDAVENAHEDTQLSLLAGDADAARAGRDELARPFLAHAQQAAWDHCREHHDQTRFGNLLEAVVAASPADRESLVADAHACAFDLEWHAFSANGTTPEASGVVAPAARGGAAPEGSLAVEADGRVRLAGRVEALHCPSPARVEADSLFVKVVTPAASVEVARQGAGADGNLLGSPLDLDVSELYGAVDLAPGAGPLELELWRHSAGCDGLYGTADVRLSKLTLGRGAGSIAFLRTSGTDKTSLFVMNADGTGQRNAHDFSISGAVAGSGVPVGQPSWSADGDRVVYDRLSIDDRLDQWYSLEILTLSDGSTAPFSSPAFPVRDQQPVWSPDGTRIAFSRAASESSIVTANLVLRNVVTGAETTITSNTGGDADWLFDWSPDGTRLLSLHASGAAPNEPYLLRAVRADGSGSEPLAAAISAAARWSPDGQHLAWLDDTAKLWLADADGAGARVVYENPMIGNPLSWSPDSTRVLLGLSVNGATGTSIASVKLDGTGFLDLSRGTRDSNSSWSR